MLVASFHSLINTLCTPEPSFSPDPKERSLAALKTKSQLFLFTFAVCIMTVQLFRGVFPFTTQILRISQMLCLIAILLLCCRSYLRIYYCILTLIASFFPMMATIQTGTVSALCTGFQGTIILYIVTDTWYYYSFCAIISICNYQIFLKQAFEITISRMGTKEFCERLIYDCSLQLFMIICFLGPLHQAIKRLNKDVVELKVQAEDSLSHYKNFLFSFSHEIRNPVNILLGSLEMAVQENLPSSALEMIQTAKISGELLLQLINNVLDVGKAEVGKLEIVPTPTRARDLLVRMWGLCSELIKKKKLTGYLKISRKLPRTLEIDPDRVNQILLNLMGNAIKFTGKGGINLTVEWLCDEESVSDASFEPVPFDKEDEGIFDKDESISTLGYSGTMKPGVINNFSVLTHMQKKKKGRENMITGRSEEEETVRERRGILKIIVKDQGCGMSGEAMKGLFKKFYQCAREASQRKRGTGLGLYITKDICESMGGKIRAYSEEGRGSVFIVCIPCKNVQDEFEG